MIPTASTSRLFFASSSQSPLLYPQKIALETFQMIFDRNGNDLSFLRSYPVVQHLSPFIADAENPLFLLTFGALASALHFSPQSCKAVFHDYGEDLFIKLVQRSIEIDCPKICYLGCVCLRRLLLFVRPLDIPVVRDVMSFLRLIFESNCPWKSVLEGIQAMTSLFKTSTAWQQLRLEDNITGYLNAFLAYPRSEIISAAFVAYSPLLVSEERSVNRALTS
jgi:hypothetical protein